MQKSPSDPTLKFPLLIFKILAGLWVINSIIFSNLIDPLWNCSSDKLRKVSIPDAPVAAWLKVSLLDSSSSGLWSDTITLIKFLFIPSIKETLSSSVLKGGDSFKNVRNSPISFSFKERLLIDTPVEKLTVSFL